MSPILVRPVREQLEHDRVIRLLQARCRRRYQVAINQGSEQNEAVGTGPAAMYPDLILTSNERGHRLEAIVEVETAESVNNLEAMAEWVPFGRLRTRFYLYVPTGSVEVARRLCTDHNVPVAEIWTYHNVGDQVRFTMVHRAPAPPAARRTVTPRTGRAATGTGSKPVARRTAKAAAKRARAKKPARKATSAQKRK